MFMTTTGEKKMNRKLRRTTDAAMRGVSVIDRELDMWAEKYSSGGSVPRSVKLRVARLVEARKVAVQMEEEKTDG
jgi:hypothetical protein